jgi:uncharacterized integral membrane protein
MIPLFAVIRWNTGRRQLGLWLPLFLAWLLLLPLLLVLLPFFVIGCLLARMNPWRLIVTGWQLVTGLRGANIELQHGEKMFQVRMI